MSKFQIGDRFVRTGGDKTWSDTTHTSYRTGVILERQEDQANHGGSGGCECDGKDCLIRDVHFDDYDYRLETWPTNCHGIAECVIEHEVTEQDIEDTLTSIKSAMR